MVDWEDDDEQTAYPASENTPGQAVSRWSHDKFIAEGNNYDGQGNTLPWLRDYLQLRVEGWDWRKAAYIAWASSPMITRWPANQYELATQVLGLRSDRTIRTWREKDPAIDERVGRLQVEPLFTRRRDLIEALFASTQLLGREGAADRRMALTITGILKPGKDGAGGENDRHGSSSKSPYSDLGEDELEQVIRNLQSATDSDEE